MRRGFRFVAAKRNYARVRRGLGIGDSGFGQAKTRHAAPALSNPESRISALAHPRLRAPEQREALEAPHLELLAAFNRGQDAAVDLAGLRIEDLAAFPFVAVLLHAPDDRHSGDRLVLALTLAGRADRVGTLVGLQHLDHPAAEFAVAFGDLDHRLRLAGGVVDGGPGADRRTVREDRRGEHEGECEQDGLAACDHGADSRVGGGTLPPAPATVKARCNVRGIMAASPCNALRMNPTLEARVREILAGVP